jgi:hypothetical protein
MSPLYCYVTSLYRVILVDQILKWLEMHVLEILYGIWGDKKQNVKE